MAKQKLEDPEIAKAPLSLIDHVQIEVEALLGSKPITIAELNALAQGDVIALGTQINDPVTLRVNGRIIGSGEIVTVNDRFAVRITQIGG
jgi:flagellar motor switch protein FliN/FliY